MLSYIEYAGAATLTIAFCLLLVYTLVRIVIVIFDSTFRSDSANSLSKKLWILFLWITFTAPFAAIIFMIISRDPETDKAIKERAFKQDTQHLKRPPPKQLYKEPVK